VALTRWLLDTSAYAGFKRGHEGVVSFIRQAEELHVTPVVIGELYSGFLGGTRERQNKEELDRFLASPRARLTDIDRETSERYAEILHFLRAQGTPVPTNDLWIAASAMQYGLKVLTFDGHFRAIVQVASEILKP
jgi:predicted nucleic acid-binding protein